MDFYLDATKLAAADNIVSIAIRCTGKKEIDPAYRRRMTEGQHPYSLVLRIAEHPEATATGDLYQQLVALNSVENIIDINLEADLDAE
jgi:hypothetical protein